MPSDAVVLTRGWVTSHHTRKKLLQWLCFRQICVLSFIVYYLFVNLIYVSVIHPDIEGYLNPSVLHGILLYSTKCKREKHASLLVCFFKRQPSLSAMFLLNLQSLIFLLDKLFLSQISLKLQRLPSVLFT